MAKINLLDWRGELRTKKRNEFYQLLGFTALLGLICVSAAFMVGKTRISNQQNRITYLNDEISAVEKRLEEIKDLEKKRQALLDRMEVIDELQASRPNIVHLFDEIVKVTPEGTYLTNVTENNRVLSISGKAESSARISNLMRDLNTSEWTKNSLLKVIQAEANTGGTIYSFSVQAALTTPEEIAQEAEDDAFELE